MIQHPLVVKKVIETAGSPKPLDYAGGERALRYDAHNGDAAAAEAVTQIDGRRAEAKKEAQATAEDVAARLGLGLDGLAALVSKLAAGPELETWLVGRANLERAHGRAFPHDHHPDHHAAN